MSVKLRLRRMGKKKQPFYRVVATDSRVARDGRYIDKIGHYNPLINPPDILIDEEKALMWLQRGAIPSDTVKNILSRKGIMLKWDLIKKGIPEETIDEEVKKWELLQLEREKRKEALETQRKRDESKEVKEEDQIREEPEAAAPSEAEKKQEEAPAEVGEKKEESPEAAAPSEAEKKQEEAPAEVEEKKEESPVEAETQNEKAEETETETDVETEETRKTEEKAD